MEFLQIENFTKGINRFIEPSFLEPTESRILRNAEISKGNISAMNGHDEFSQEGGFYFFNLIDFIGVDKWFYHEKPLLWYELTKTIYYSALDRTSDVTAKDKDGNDKGTLGVVAPTNEPSVNIEAGAGHFYKDDTYYYVYTYLKGSAESKPSPQALMKILTDGDAIKVTTPLASSVGADKVLIYRMGVGSSSYMFVHEFDGGDFIDNIPARNLGDVLDSFNNDIPPKGLILDCAYKQKIVGHIEGDNVVRFSKEVHIDSWSPLETISLDSTIVRIVEFNGQLIVLCATAIYRIAGTHIDNFTVDRIPTEQGCLHFQSIVESRGILFWQSDDGICAFDGAGVTVLSTNNIPKAEIKGRILSAVSQDEQVYFADKDGIYILDVARGMTWREADSAGNTRGLYYSYRLDALFSSDGTKTYKLFNNPNNRMQVQWKTGRIKAGSLVTLKQFVKVMIFGKGRFNFQLKVDDDIAVRDIEVDLSTTPKEVILPMATNGRYLEILMVGNSKVHSDEQIVNTILVGYDVIGIGK